MKKIKNAIVFDSVELALGQCTASICYQAKREKPRFLAELSAIRATALNDR
jgi:hypothetical protein